MKVERIERGWGGHFCGARHCGFRRNTLLVLGETRIVVSTVGNYRNQQEIGVNRYYETMAFHAQRDTNDVYWDADVSREVHFDSPWALDEGKWESDQKANDMHETVVQEISERLIALELQS